jgi:hypothetical protein
MSILFLIILIFIYFIPSIIASNRHHKNKDAIIILNLLLGWTFLGWVVALVWAYTDNISTVKQDKEPQQIHCSKCGSQITENDKFCSKCGANLEEVKINEASQVNLEKITQEEKFSKFIKSHKFIIGIFIVILFILVIIGNYNPSNDTNKNLEKYNIQQKIKPDLEVIKYQAYNSDYSTYIGGTIQNNTDRTYSYVQISINLYDNAGNQIGSTMDNTNNLEPHGKWKFKALVYGIPPNQSFRYKIMGVTGW